MTTSIAYQIEYARSLRGLLPLWVGMAVYALFLLAGNRLLIDPDTMWQVTVGQWIIDHHSVPHTDIYSFTMYGQPWISTEWLAQVAYAWAYSVAGWAGPVVMASLSIAATFALFVRFLRRYLTQSTTLVFFAGALALMVPHLLARPHVLAMPVMVMWVGGLLVAADRRKAPSFWLLPLMTLWANLHGGFVLGLFLVAPFGIDAVLTADKSCRKALSLEWIAFSLAAFAMSCATPYGWNSLLAAKRIIDLGDALSLIIEWRPADFSSVGALEVCILASLGLALFRSVTLPALRILIVLGLLHMALSHSRNLELFALLAPMTIACPLGKRINLVEEQSVPAEQSRSTLFLGLGICILTGTIAFASEHHFEPHPHGSPVAAVTALKKLKVSRVFNAYDFGGYMIANGVAPFIDGRTELYGAKFMISHNNASTLDDPETLFRLLEEYKIEATLMRTKNPAAKLLDHLDGWQKVYADDIAVIHIRKPDTVHTAEPVIDSIVK